MPSRALPPQDSVSACFTTWAGFPSKKLWESKLFTSAILQDFRRKCRIFYSFTGTLGSSMSIPAGLGREEEEVTTPFSACS